MYQVQAWVLKNLKDKVFIIHKKEIPFWLEILIEKLKVEEEDRNESAVFLKTSQNLLQWSYPKEQCVRTVYLKSQKSATEPGTKARAAVLSLH